VRPSVAPVAAPAPVASRPVAPRRANGKPDGPTPLQPRHEDYVRF
jgi:hypothetical protein